MARTARLKSSTGIYHVMMRGSNRQNIFLEDSDKDKFLVFVKSALTRPIAISGRDACVCDVLAYALMGNHFHMLIKVISGTLGDFIKRIAAGYVGYFNEKYDRDGHLFRERFKSEPCETFDYFSVLIGYIHRNPVKHGFAASVDDYPYTSWKEYSDPEAVTAKICNVGEVLGKMSIGKIREMVYAIPPGNLKCVDIDNVRNQISDESLIGYLKESYGIDNPMAIKEHAKSRRNCIIKELLDYGGSVRQLERLTGVDKMIISRLNKEE